MLARHNPLKECAGGVYDVCEELAGASAAELLAALNATPQVPVKPHYCAWILPRCLSAF
ncbi:MAG: hypothetical protein ACREQR_04745 [Candidatus Binataceae bacterium]